MPIIATILLLSFGLAFINYKFWKQYPDETDLN